MEYKCLSLLSSWCLMPKLSMTSLMPGLVFKTESSICVGWCCKTLKLMKLKVTPKASPAEDLAHGRGVSVAWVRDLGACSVPAGTFSHRAEGINRGDTISSSWPASRGHRKALGSAGRPAHSHKPFRAVPSLAAAVHRASCGVLAAGDAWGQLCPAARAHPWQGRALRDALPSCWARVLCEPWVAAGSPAEPGDSAEETRVKNMQILNPVAFVHAYWPFVLTHSLRALENQASF